MDILTQNIFFFIRNEEEYINRRTDIGERKETKEREKTKGRMRRKLIKTHENVRKNSNK